MIEPQKELVTILINNYNYAKYLTHGIESGLNQSYQAIEVIVVDDGSTDKSKKILDNYSSKIKTIYQKNEGQASAINTGYKNSNGEILCLLDSDDWFHKNKVQEIVNIFNKHPEIGWLFHPLIQYYQIDGSELKVVPPFIEGTYDFTREFKNGKMEFWAPATSGLCFRRDLLKKILPMPQAEGINISDKYLKDLAVGLSEGYSSNNFLAFQRIHEKNRYTQNSENLKLKVNISINYAYWVRMRFPEFSERANREFSYSIFLNWKLPKESRVNNSLKGIYLSKLCLYKKIETFLRAIYYYLRNITRAGKLT